jgi:peptidoglycan DL-endopeptidase CwlO
MSMIDALASLQQVRATFAGLTGGGAPMTADPGTSSTDFDNLIEALTAPSTSATTSDVSDSSDVSDASDAASAVAGSASASGTSAAGPSLDTGAVTGSDVVADARKYIGVPYVFGGESTSGMDCSGLVQKTFKDLGISLPRGVDTQKLQGKPVASLADAKPGDLIVFKGGGHIAIYAGNDMVIHAPYPGRKVSLQKLWVGDAGIETIRQIVPPTSTSTTAASTAAASTTAATTAATSSSTVTLAQAQAAVTASQQAMMQADLAMMSSPSDPDSSTTDPTSSLTGTSDATTDSTSTTAASASAASTDAIQQFLTAQETLMAQGASS